MLISENDTHFEVCPFSQTSIRLRASLTADMIDQRKHLALHMRDMASIRHPRNRATEQLMGKTPQSYTKTPLSLVFKGGTALKKTFQAAHSVVVTCHIAISVFQGKTGGPNH